MSESALGDLGAEPRLLSGTDSCHMENPSHIELSLGRFSWDKNHLALIREYQELSL